MPLRIGALVSAFVAAVAVQWTTPAAALDGQRIITQAAILNGGFTPGDRKGFPLTISAPGSYKFAENILVIRRQCPQPPRGQPKYCHDGIVVTSEGVTIDFNGFQLVAEQPGVGGSDYLTKDGITSDAVRLTIRNGSISGFSRHGIKYSGAFLVLEDMVIVDNVGSGLEAGAALDSRIRNDTIANNKLYGVNCGTYCHVESNILSGNGRSGVRIVSGAVLGNTISHNRGRGIEALAEVGYGNNSISLNSGKQISGTQIRAMLPNACVPAC